MERAGERASQSLLATEFQFGERKRVLETDDGEGGRQ